MKTKEKKHKQIKLKIRIKNAVIALAFIVIILYSVQFYYCYFANSKTYGKEEETSVEPVKEFKISNANEIDLDKIVEQNYNANRREETQKEEVVLEYLTKYQTNAKLAKGTVQVLQEGREGKQEIITKKIYDNDELVSQEQLSAKVTKASINKIVEVGTANFSNTYTSKVGNTLYVTAQRLSVWAESNDNSKKVATLEKDNELKILEINDDWYKISSGSIIGWVKGESTTNINPNAQIENEDNNKDLNEKSASDLNAKLEFNMALNSPSGLSLDQFKKVLSDNNDTNKIFENNAQYFYYIEKQYNINGIFVASMGIHESAWGTSQIAKNKNNLFGYGAYDSNPYNGAYNFSNCSEAIDLIARVLVKYYLNSKGTNIYGGEVAVGTYYNGATLSGVNTRYATDKNWANAVYTYMKYLYEKL